MPINRDAADKTCPKSSSGNHDFGESSLRGFTLEKGGPHYQGMIRNCKKCNVPQVDPDTPLEKVGEGWY